MADEDLPEPLQLPLGWESDELGWLAPSRWLARAFPALGRRREALVDRVTALLNACDPALASSASALLREVWSVPSAVTTTAIAVLHDRIQELPAGTSVGAHALHFVIAANACLRSGTAEHPILFASECCEWSTIPPQLAELAVELTVFFPYWHDASMRGVLQPVPAPGLADDSIDVELAESAAEEPTGFGSAFRREAGSADVQKDSVQRRIGRLMSRLAAAFAREVQPIAGNDDWSPYETLGNWIRGTVPQFSSLGTVTRRHDYFLQAMTRLDHRHPCMLPLYEAYADGCDRSHWDHLEPVAIALASSASGAHADALLRAATRRFVAGDRVEAGALAHRAFTAITGTDDRRAAWFAAGLIARVSTVVDPLAARAWLTTAQSLADGEHSAARLGLGLDLAAVCDSLGDELGRQRAMKEVEQLRASMDADHLAGLVDACSRPIESDVHFRWGSPSLDAIAELVSTGSIDDGYARYSEEIGRLVETANVEAILEQLHALLDRAQASIQPQLVTRLRLPAAPTLAAWTCAAIADLHDAAGDDDGWEAMKLRQFTFEDDYGAASEPDGHTDDRDEVEKMLAKMFEEVSCPLPPEFQVGEMVHARAIYRAMTEAEHALALGNARRARFWTSRAHALRTARTRT